MYITLMQDADLERTYNNQNWAFQLKSLLESLGLPNLWLNQEHYTIEEFRIIGFYLYHVTSIRPSNSIGASGR